MKPILLVLFVAIVASGCGQQSAPANAKTNAPATGNPLTAPVDYIGAVGKAKNSAQRSLDMSSLIQAIQLFRETEERLPSSLNELVQMRYIARLPEPPPGMRLTYDPQRGVAAFVRQP